MMIKHPLLKSRAPLQITFQLIFTVVAIITLVVSGFTYMQVRQERRRLAEDLNRRAHWLSEGLHETLDPLLARPNPERLGKIVEKFGNRERMAGVALYDALAKPITMTPILSESFQAVPGSVRETLQTGNASGKYAVMGDRPFYLYFSPIGDTSLPRGVLMVVQKADHVDQRIRDVWKTGFLRLLIQSLLISLATILVIRWNVTKPIAQVVEWLRKWRLGEADELSGDWSKELFGPLAKEVSHMARSLSEARSAAEEEARLRHSAESIWTAERLKEHVKQKLQDKPVFVISNREPYMHVRRGKEISWIVPASGLVTALEPVLRACGGTWIAHGAGDADRDVVDAYDRVRVPPDDPQYVLRRLWLTKEEEDGYYYGFSNEGMWPLCHIAHTRPAFRAEDWRAYQSVNKRFADAALEEMKDVSDPFVFVQDYHFALVPRLIKQARPDARVAVFWHIPWPNPESFGICPWKREILHGLLGADLIGFHVQFHCNNFLDTVDKSLECQIDWERFSVSRQGHTSWIKPFPISVDFNRYLTRSGMPRSGLDKPALLRELGVQSEFLGVGVDRIDYTKGIVERLHAVEKFLETYPEYQGRFTFVELGAPSRSLIKRYHDLEGEIQAEVDRINWKFKGRDWRPIIFLKKHHSHSDIEPYYRAADVCLVTSLHDGMNLVAKEYVASREEGSGVLILSRFTGAARELRDALLVNPYDIDQVAQAIHLALEMSDDEKRQRMERLRENVREKNIYTWASSLVTELSHVRVKTPAVLS